MHVYIHISSRESQNKPHRSTSPCPESQEGILKDRYIYIFLKHHAFRVHLRRQDNAWAMLMKRHFLFCNRGCCRLSAGASRQGLTADKITSARAVQFLYAEVVAVIIHPILSPSRSLARSAGRSAFNDDISRVAYNACTRTCARTSGSTIQFHEGCNVLKTGWGEKKGREKKKEHPIFKPISTGVRAYARIRTYTSSFFSVNTRIHLRTCIAVKPQKLFFLGGAIPLALSGGGEARPLAPTLMRRLLFWNATMSRPGMHTRAARITRVVQ